MVSTLRNGGGTLKTGLSWSVALSRMAREVPAAHLDGDLQAVQELEVGRGCGGGFYEGIAQINSASAP